MSVEPFAMTSDDLKDHPYYTNAPTGSGCSGATGADSAMCHFQDVTDNLATLEKENANGDGQYTDEFLRFGKIQMQTAQLWLGIAGMVYLLYRNE